MAELKLPVSESAARQLRVGQTIELTGRMVTGRDAAHKWLLEGRRDEVMPFLRNSIIYHCGPVVRKDGDKWKFVAAGPTTSIREEPYQAKVIEMYGVRGVIGKGGMKEKTLEGCKKFGAVYLHAIGGCGTQIAQSVKEVLAVHKLEGFGTPEAFWVCRVENFQVVVTMDSHGKSLHDTIEETSRKRFEELIAG